MSNRNFYMPITAKDTKFARSTKEAFGHFVTFEDDAPKRVTLTSLLNIASLVIAIAILVFLIL